MILADAIDEIGCNNTYIHACQSSMYIICVSEEIPVGINLLQRRAAFEYMLESSVDQRCE